VTVAPYDDWDTNMLPLDVLISDNSSFRDKRGSTCPNCGSREVYASHGEGFRCEDCLHVGGDNELKAYGVCRSRGGIGSWDG